jgi:hypothetical protein
MKKNIFLMFGVFFLGIIIGALGMSSLKSVSPQKIITQQILRPGNKTSAISYTNERYGFSFEHPPKFSINEIKDGVDTTIVFQGEKSENGFQIYILPYGGEQITPERIRTDVPGGLKGEAVEVIIGGNIRALAFWGESPGIGKTREVWFIRNGYLYEFTAYANFDAELAAIMNTLTFNN